MTEREMFGCRFKYEEDKLFRLDKRSKRWTCCSDRRALRRGYIQVRVNGKTMSLHRLVYYFHNPEWDMTDDSHDNSIDHINQIKTDNRIENLRVVNNSQNNQNKTHYGGRPIRGVCYCKRDKRWKAQWNQDGKRRCKYFDSEAEALACRREMVKLHHSHAPIEMKE